MTGLTNVGTGNMSCRLGMTTTAGTYDLSMINGYNRSPGISGMTGFTGVGGIYMPSGFTSRSGTVVTTKTGTDYLRVINHNHWYPCVSRMTIFTQV